MSMTIAEMRSIVYNGIQNESVYDYDNILTESALANLCNQILDEAYYGTKVVDPILKAMRSCCDLLDRERDPVMRRTKENDDLEKAVEKVFGVKHCSIYWENHGGIVAFIFKNPITGKPLPITTKGPYTFLGSTISLGYKPAFKYGNHADGFYDTNHELYMVINMSIDLYRDAQLTPEEMTAMLLHEIGHNFDFSPFNMIDGWTSAILAMFALFSSIGSGNVSAGFNVIAKMFYKTAPGKELSIIMTNIDSILMDLIPPLGMVGRGVGRIAGPIVKLLMNIISLPTMVLTIPIGLMMSPIMTLVSTFGRKKEIYADAFAAGYGYAEPLTSALAKCDKAMTRYNMDDASPLMETLYDMMLFQQEFTAMFLDKDGHGNTQQRMIKVRHKLEQDLANNEVDPALKSELKRKIKEIDDAYEAFVNIDPDDQNRLTAFMRSCVDKAYNGKNYMFIPPVGNEYPE